MIVLGINAVYHELAAALIVDGKLVAAAEEERFNRRKHGKAARVDNPHELPVRAIEYCLKQADVQPCDIDVVGYSFDLATRRQSFRPDPYSVKGDWGDRDGEALFQARLSDVPRAISAALDRDVSGVFQWVPHHVAHAASAYYPSGLQSAAVLAVDGIGEHTTALLAAGDGPAICPLEQIDYPDSVGFLWEKLSKFLGFSEYDACKVMGLAAYGDAAALRSSFDEFVSMNGRVFALDPAVLEFRLDRFAGLESLFGPRRTPGEPLEPRHADIAAALQACTDEIMLRLVRRLYALHPSRALCMAGGVALNCQSNWRIKEEGQFEEIHIPSAPHDAGTAIGAALYVYRTLLRGGPVDCSTLPYSGPEYSDAQVRAALDAHGLAYQRPSDLMDETARRLADGQIVGWFQGRLEFGPRALGNRSLLADPRSRDSRERMNRSVKRRESFRPFAPSVLEERGPEWFELGRPSPAYASMLFACPARPDKVPLIPAVLHVDGTARLQLVNKVDNPRFHALISAFEARTAVPMVLNTSFNDSEPIVGSPEDAISTFCSTDIDALVIGDYLVDARARPSSCS